MPDPIANWARRIGRRLTLRDLHIFLAVVQWGSMAKAAAHLSISQPAISKSIADLERAVGARLLDRSPRGIEPTAFGRALARRGLAVFDELRQGISEIEFLADPTAGEVRIGCPESIAAGLLPAVAEEFSRRFPRMVLRVAQAQTVTLEFRELRERHVDLMIGRIARPFAEEGLAAEVLFDEPLHLVAGVQSRWARRRKLSLAELAHAAWILTPPNEVLSAPVAAVFQEHGLETPRDDRFFLVPPAPPFADAHGLRVAHPRLGAAPLQRASARAEGAAGRCRLRIAAGGDRHAQESIADAGSEAVYRLRAGNGRNDREGAGISPHQCARRPQVGLRAAAQSGRRLVCLTSFKQKCEL